MTNDIHQILTERGDRYGNFETHADLSQSLKSTIFQSASARSTPLSPDQREALEMIMHKVARIINGDPNYSDSWRDIAGYSTLVADRLDRTSTPQNAATKPRFPAKNKL